MGGCWCINTQGGPGQGPPHPKSCEMTDATSCLCLQWAEGPGGADSITPSSPGPGRAGLCSEKRIFALFSLGYLRKSGRGHTSEVYPEHTSMKRGGFALSVRATQAGRRVLGLACPRAACFLCTCFPAPASALKTSSRYYLNRSLGFGGGKP